MWGLLENKQKRFYCKKICLSVRFFASKYTKKKNEFVQNEYLEKNKKKTLFFDKNML